MQIKLNKIGIGVALAAALLLGNAARLAAQDAKMPTDAECKLTPIQAIKAATAKVPGHPVSANYELDEGKWVYNVWIVVEKKMMEVGVDPVTGKVGEAEAITPDQEAKDVKKEMKELIASFNKAPVKESGEKGAKSEKPAKPVK